MYDPVARENEIMDTLREFADSGLEFVVVGGYAVSAFRHRFSIDADIVIRKGDRGKFEQILHERNYRKAFSTQLENICSSEFVRYENSGLKVNIDLLIGGLGVRQTGAAFSFEFLWDNSAKKLIEGTDKAVKTHVPSREILIVLKLHSGRLTDLRDVAALSFDLNLNVIRKNLFIGNQSVLKKNMEKLKALTEKPEFRDSFKGVFMEKGYRINPNEINKLAKLESSSK